MACGAMAPSSPWNSSGATLLTRHEIIHRVTRRADVPRLRGDHDHPGVTPSPGPLKSAAVLVPLVERADGFTILLTKRTDHLTDHAGQISFPGGRIEADDPSPEAAALREAEEEIGLARDRVEVVGRLDPYHTTTGYAVMPIVGLVPPGLTLRPDPFEVAEIFEVPLDFVLDPTNVERHSRDWRGTTRHFFVLPYQQWYIWGATAGMLVNLAETLRASPPYP